MILVPYLQIRANSIYSFQINEDRSYTGRSIQSLLTQNLREHATYTGTLKQGAKKRLTKAIDFMVMSTKERKIFNPVTHRKQPFQVGFITLTFHSTNRNITGKEAHKTCLEPFIKWMRQVHGCKSYIWKAELQKRGQIHYHLTTDVFIHWKAMRDKWNELQHRAGYLDTFFAKYGHWDANSIDVHSTKSKLGLSGYLIKEIAKSFQNEKTIGGKVWDCSMNLKVCKYFSVNERMDYAFVNQMVKDKEMKVIETDHCFIYQFFNKPASCILSSDKLLEYNAYMATVRNEAVIQPVVKKEVRNEVKEVLERSIVPVRFRQSIQLTLSRYTRPPLMNVLIEPELFCSS